MKAWIAVIVASVLYTVIHLMSGGDDNPASRRAESSSGAARARPVSVAPFSAERPVRPPISAPADIAEADRAVAIAEGSGLPGPGAAPSFGELQDRLEVFFNAATGDTAWNQSSVDTLTRNVHSVLPPGSQLQRLECRGALCRIETSHLDVDEFRTYTRDAFHSAETRIGLGGAFVGLLGEPTPGSPVRAVSYLARDGTELPSVEALFAAR